LVHDRAAERWRKLVWNGGNAAEPFNFVKEAFAAVAFTIAGVKFWAYFHHSKGAPPDYR
jgi:hypothetical protein